MIEIFFWTHSWNRGQTKKSKTSFFLSSRLTTKFLIFFFNLFLVYWLANAWLPKNFLFLSTGNTFLKKKKIDSLPQINITAGGGSFLLSSLSLSLKLPKNFAIFCLAPPLSLPAAFSQRLMKVSLAHKLNYSVIPRKMLLLFQKHLLFDFII